MEQERWMYPGVDPERANVARIYDYLLGGTHNFDVDRAAARILTAIEPTARDGEPETILGHPETRRLIDFDQPVGLLLVGILHFVDVKRPGDLVSRLAGALVSGSCLAISHATFDGHSASEVRAMQQMFTHRATATLRHRDYAEIREFFDGFDLVEPGLVFTSQWRPDGPAPLIDQPERTGIYVGVGRKP